MNSLLPWLEALQCPDCGASISTQSGKDTEICCSGCKRAFDFEQGIWNFLPRQISNLEGKEKEKDGWRCKDEEELSGGTHPESFYLCLPEHPHPYYQAAAWYLRIVIEYGKPWTGRRSLELGAAECWGTRRLVEAGAEGVALDYDPRRMRLGQVLIDRFGISFARVQGDAERLPFGDGTLDRVFCCSVFHHFFDLEAAAREIARVLRPGGIFFAIHEAFHPPYYNRDQIVAMSDDTVPNLSIGINEQSFTAARYRRLFKRAGLRVELLHPRWDVREENGALTVEPGINVYDRRFVPSSLSLRTWRRDLTGLLARLALKSNLWRLAVLPPIFRLIRFQLLNWSIKDKILVVRKPA